MEGSTSKSRGRRVIDGTEAEEAADEDDEVAKEAIVEGIDETEKEEEFKFEELTEAEQE